MPLTATGVLSRLAAERVEQAGIDVARILRKADLPPTLLNEAGVRVDVRNQIAFLNMAADALEDDLIGFHIAQEFDLRELGLIYYVMASSENLGDAIMRRAQYSAIVNEGLKVSSVRSPEFKISFEYVGLERYLDRHELEFWVTCTLRQSRFFTNRGLIPTYVEFIHRRDRNISEMERYFACGLNFGAAGDRIAFEFQAADLPLVTADPYLNAILADEYERRLRDHPLGPSRLRVRVENAITPRLPHGNVSIRSIAMDLGMSPRTLSRRLAEEGLTFSVVLDDLRSVLAHSYLRNSELSISQITWLLGYSEASSFVHAFQRWEGMSPTDARRRIMASIEAGEEDHDSHGRPP